MSFAWASERPWRDAWPLVAQTDDGNPWETGLCWLYCRREGARVLWVGSVKTPGATGDAFACGPCLAELDHMVRVQSHGRDGAGDHIPASTTLGVPAYVPAPLPSPPPSGASVGELAACLHQRIERRGGKAHCGDCRRQLYL